MEQWDIYDINRNKTGRIMNRGEELKNGEYHLAVQVCIFNEKGQMLIQQRQPFESDWSNMWDITTAGSALAGETSQQAAERELFEELGYRIDLTNIRPKFTVNFDGGFCDIYLIERDVDIEILTLQYEEVQAVKWADREEILEMMDRREFITYYRSFIELMFDGRKSYGSHSSMCTP